MSSQSDGPNRPDDIETVKQLLRKLEEIAAREAGEPTAEAVPAGEDAGLAPLLGLSQLSRGEPRTIPTELEPFSLAPAAAVPAANEPAAWRAETPETIDGEINSAQSNSPEFAGPMRPAEPLEIGLPAIRPPSELQVVSTAPEHRGWMPPKSTLALAAASFVLGIAAAGTLVAMFDPFKRAPARTAAVADQPQPVAPKLAEPAAAPFAEQAAATAEPVSQPQKNPVVATIPGTHSETVGKPPGVQAAAPFVAAKPDANDVAADQRAAQATAPAAIPPAEVNTPVLTAQVAPPQSIDEAAKLATNRAVEPRPLAAGTEGRPAIAAAAPVEQTTAAVAADAAPVSRPPATNEPSLRIAPQIELAGGERRAVGLSFSPPATPEARLLLVFRQLPDWLSLSRGGAIGNQIWLVSADEASELTIEAGSGAAGSADITVQLARMGGEILAERTFSVKSLPRPEPPSTRTVSPARDDAMTSRLQARGEFLLDTGEVEAARTLLRTAAEAGSVEAALRLAETYDPSALPRLGLSERSADPVQAVRWYQRAQMLGSTIAADRLVALGRN